MSAVKVMAVDHETFSRSRLRSLLSLDPECELIRECTDGAEALLSFRSAQPDILFVDTLLPETDVFEVIRAIPQPAPLVILTALGCQYAVRAFEARVFDYLLKPLEPARFHESLDRAKAEIGRTRRCRAQSVPRPAQPPGRIAVRQNNRVLFLTLDQIDWIEAADNYVCIHSGPATHLLRETMRDVEASLDSSRFVRVHRSAIVNVDRIKELQPWFRGDYRVILRDGTMLTLTKTYRENVDAQLLLGPL